MQVFDVRGEPKLEMIVTGAKIKDSRAFANSGEQCLSQQYFSRTKACQVD
jgi:hypothetical protein